MSITHNLKHRIKGLCIHLLISLTVVAIVFAYLYFIAFPPPLFVGGKGINLLILISWVDVVIGPLLTFVALTPQKPRKTLHKDLIIIAILQISALLYGFSVVLNARPIYIVFDADGFYAVSRADITEEEWEKAGEYQHPSLFSPTWVGTKKLTDPKDISYVELFESVGLGRYVMPRFYQKLETNYDEIKTVSVTLNQITPYAQEPQHLIDWWKDNKMEEKKAKLLLLNVLNSRYFVSVDSDGKPITMIPIQALSQKEYQDKYKKHEK